MSAFIGDTLDSVPYVEDVGRHGCRWVYVMERPYQCLLRFRLYEEVCGVGMGLYYSLLVCLGQVFGAAWAVFLQIIFVHTRSGWRVTLATPASSYSLSAKKRVFSGW